MELKGSSTRLSSNWTLEARDRENEIFGMSPVLFRKGGAWVRSYLAKDRFPKRCGGMNTKK